MKSRSFGFVLPLLFLLSAWAEVKGPAWQSDPQHPLLQYRFVCRGGQETVIWQNGYPGALTLKTRLKSFSYDGTEDVQIGPSASANTDLDTLACGNFQVSITRFSMAAPPPPPPPAVTKAASVSDSKTVPPPVAPIVVQFEPQTEPLPEITTELLASITTGMNQAEVRQRLGDPLSKVSIPDDNGLIETYRYNVTHGRTGSVRFANGIVAGIISPR